jgi:hypothetical protein
MALADRYGSGFLAGTKGQTFAAGYDVTLSGVNNAGTLVHAGTPASDSPVQSVLTMDELADDQGTSHGSKIVANDGTGANTTDRAGVKKAVSGGTLAYSAGATEWVMQGGNVTTTLGGVANDLLIGGQRDYAGDLNDDATEVARTKIKDVKQGLYSARGFNMTARPSTNINPNRSGSGTDGKGTGAGSAFTFVNPADGTAAVAAEIAPSRSVPGELVYRDGSAEPVQDDYKASNAAEA